MVRVLLPGGYLEVSGRYTDCQVHGCEERCEVRCMACDVRFCKVHIWPARHGCYFAFKSDFGYHR